MDIYEELIKNTYEDWEWIVLLNGDAERPDISDSRVKFYSDSIGMSNMPIGGIKHKCFNLATGDVLVELDHDDIPMVGFMDEIAIAFADDTVDFAYSDFAEFDVDKNPIMFDDGYGWKYYDVFYNGIYYKAAKAPPFSPPYIYDITHAPNHFRCWRADFYRMIGGHNKDMFVGDDLDLLYKTYIHMRNFKYINKCLYLYRNYGNNTYKERQKILRDEVSNCYSKYLFDTVRKFSKIENGLLLNFGVGNNPMGGFDGVDIINSENVKYNIDISKTLPFEKSSVAGIVMYDIVEHISNKIDFFNEIYRVLMPNGSAIIKVPICNNLTAFRDPTHVSFWNKKSFEYFYDNKKFMLINHMAKLSFTCVHLTEFTECNIRYLFIHLTAIKQDEFDKWMPMKPNFPEVKTR